jgi:hypothetical protein
MPVYPKAAGDGGGAGGYSANCQATDIPDASEVRFLRFTVPAGKTCNIIAAGVYPSGIANHVVEVYNLTDVASEYSTNSSFAEGSPLATIAAGKEVVFRVRNTSGAERTGSLGWIAFTVD